MMALLTLSMALSYQPRRGLTTVLRVLWNANLFFRQIVIGLVGHGGVDSIDQCL